MGQRRLYGHKCQHKVKSTFKKLQKNRNIFFFKLNSQTADDEKTQELEEQLKATLKFKN